MMSRIVLMVAALAVLSACAQRFRSDVSTFHEVAPRAGLTFSITPMNQAKLDSIEYGHYAAAIVAQLERSGFSPAAEGEKGDVIVGFDILQSEGREQIYSRPAPTPLWFGRWGWGGWRAFYGPGFIGPWAGGPWGAWGAWGGGFQRELDARTVYPTTLFVEIRDSESGKLQFEGRAITEARSRALPNTIPLLAASLFTDFPGPGMGTRRVSLTLDDNGNVVSEKTRELADGGNAPRSRGYYP